MEDWKNGGVEEEGESVSEKGDEEENGGPDEEEITDKEDITEEEKVVGPKEKTDKDDKEDIKEGEDRETEQSGTGVQKEEEWPKDKEEEFILPPESEGPELETADDRVDDTKTESVGEKEIKKSNRNTLWIISGAIFVILTGFVLLSLFTDVFSDRIDIDGIFGSPDEDIEINDDFSGEEFEFDRMVDEMEDEIDSATRMENALDPGVSGEESESAVAPVETAPAASTTADYHIIAGSFRSESNAGELQQQLTLQGYTPLIIELDNGIYRVSAISFSDKATALRELIGFREKTGIESAWLMNLD